MIHKKRLLPSLAALPVVLFSSCASRERMGRMSGTLQSYRKPAPDRIEHFYSGGAEAARIVCRTE